MAQSANNKPIRKTFRTGLRNFIKEIEVQEKIRQLIKLLKVKPELQVNRIVV